MKDKPTASGAWVVPAKDGTWDQRWSTSQVVCYTFIRTSPAQQGKHWEVSTKQILHFLGYMGYEIASPTSSSWDPSQPHQKYKTFAPLPKPGTAVQHTSGNKKVSFHKSLRLLHGRWEGGKQSDFSEWLLRTQRLIWFLCSGLVTSQFAMSSPRTQKGSR